MEVDVYGLASVCETIGGQWLEDISQNQVNKLLKGLAPIRLLLAVSSGTSKLVSLPVKSYKKYQKLLKGPQRGLSTNLRWRWAIFFTVWFVVGNVWVFGGPSSASGAPNLFRLCIMFLTFSYIGYAMPYILCAMICCCLPCIISLIGIREDMGQTRVATTELIDALPTYNFKSKPTENGEETDLDSPREGGILAAGTIRKGSSLLKMSTLSSSQDSGGLLSQIERSMLDFEIDICNRTLCNAADFEDSVFCIHQSKCTFSTVNES